MKSFFSLLLLVMPILVVAQFGFQRNNDIVVIKNNVQQKFPWVGGMDYCHFSNIDLNLDGVQDLFIFDKSCDKVLTFVQKGATGQMDFEYAPQYENAFPQMYGWVLLADYDGDGKKDIWSTSPAGASVFKNISTAQNGLAFERVTNRLPTTYLLNGTILNTTVSSSQGDVPAIADIDNDGDMDFLAFYFNSNCVHYYRNMSQELYGHSDSLEFKTSSTCYGNFSESNTTNLINLNSCCALIVDNPEFDGGRGNDQVTDRHAGSAILSLDLDADGMHELLIGDISYKNVVKLQNDANAPNTDIDLIAPDYAFPSYDRPIEISVFPAPFHVDVNNDGERDLVISPNSNVNSNNFRSMWMYLNTSVDNNPDFEFQTEGFLQGDMIDGGSESYPVFFDYSGDGLEDLFVSITERYDSVSTNGYSQILYYENTGSAIQAEFTLITEDFMGLSNFNGVKHLFYRPAFGDADGDGDKDMLLSDFNDTMYYFDNTAGAGNMASFGNATPFKNNLGQIVNEGIQIAPKFVDLDRDGKQDLVIGKRNGKLAYYKNVTVGSNYAFEQITGSLGGVDVSEYWTVEGIAAPEFVDIDNEYHLICGSRNGNLHYYDGIEGNLGGTFNLVDSTFENIYVGDFSTVAAMDIDGDNKIEMLVGNRRGGLVSYESAIVTNVGLSSVDFNNLISVYPNPAKNQFFIDLSEINFGSYTEASYSLLDISGKTIQNRPITSAKTNVEIRSLSKGIYFIVVALDGQKSSHKIVVQ